MRKTNGLSAMDEDERQAADLRDDEVERKLLDALVTFLEADRNARSNRVS
jgi:hypothetical protein